MTPAFALSLAAALGLAGSAAAQPHWIALHFKGLVDGSDRLRIDARWAKWTNLHWGAPAGIVLMNGIAWRPGRLPFLRNANAHRFLPDDVDFSSAQLHVVRARDLVGLTAEDDAVTVALADTPNGAAEYEFFVTFRPKSPEAEAPVPAPAGAPAELLIRAWIDGSDVLRIDRKRLQWTNVHWGAPRRTVVIGNQPWDVRAQPIRENRFLPEGVDLSTARAVRVRGRDTVHVEAARNQVVVRFADNPPGAAIYDVKLQFGPEPPAPISATSPRRAGRRPVPARR